MSLVHLLISLYIWVIIIAALLSWLPTNTPSGGLAGVRRVFDRMTDPVLRPLRAVLPRPRSGAMAIDLSPLVAVVALIIINNVI